MRVFTNLSLLLFLFVTVSTHAQSRLTHPMVVDVTYPSNIATTFDEDNYGYQSQWGPTSISTIVGQLKWAFDVNNDSLACDSIPAGSLAGNVALIRRGACAFTSKVENAEAAGAVACIICNSLNSDPNPDATINMSGSSTSTIPTIFISVNNCSALAAALDAGDSVSVTFRKPALSSAKLYETYAVPLDYVLEGIDVAEGVVTNNTTAIRDITTTYTVTLPDGSTDVQTVVSSALAPDEIDTVEFAFVPQSKGLYTVSMKTDVNNVDTFLSSFYVTEDYFAIDDGANFFTETPEKATHIEDYRHDIAASYVLIDDTATIEYVHFGLANSPEMLGKQFVIRLCEVNGRLQQGEDWTQTTGIFTPIALGSKTITASDTASGITFFDVPLISPATNDAPVLQVGPQGQRYLVAVTFQGDSTDASDTIPPSYVYSGYKTYSFAYSLIWTSAQFYGSFSGENPVLRMYTSPITGVETLTALEESAVSIFPNPASEQLSVAVELEELSSNLSISVIDVRGRILKEHAHSDVLNETYQLDIKDLASGTYFVRILTDKGVRVKQFTKK